MEPLQQFICDTCGQIINDPSQGCVEWILDGNIYKKFKIVHRYPHSPLTQLKDRCYQHNHCSMDLIDFLGAEGVITQLRLLNEVSGNTSDHKEWVELHRRTHIPYYEEARQYLPNVISNYRWDGFSDSTIYSEEILIKTIRNQGNDPHYQPY